MQTVINLFWDEKAEKLPTTNFHIRNEYYDKKGFHYATTTDVRSTNDYPGLFPTEARSNFVIQGDINLIGGVFGTELGFISKNGGKVGVQSNIIGGSFKYSTDKKTEYNLNSIFLGDKPKLTGGFSTPIGGVELNYQLSESGENWEIESKELAGPFYINMTKNKDGSLFEGFEFGGTESYGIGVQAELKIGFETKGGVSLYETQMKKNAQTTVQRDNTTVIKNLIKE